MQDCYAAFFQALGDVPQERSLMMHTRTSFRIGGPANALFPRDTAELLRIMQAAEAYTVTPLVLGNCTNLLVSDAGIEEPVVFINGALSGIEQKNGFFTVQAGTLLSTLSKEALRMGYMGLEWANGIPGSVGGGIAMNAGAYGGEIKTVLQEVTYIESGALHTKEAKPDDLAYRYSAFAAPSRITVSARFLLQPDDGHAAERMRDFTQRRVTKQPLQYPSAGSVFKRPEGCFAGSLIEQAGLKGEQIGGARVSELHAGFIINTGGATCADVLALIEQVQERVLAHSGVMLEPEIKIIGKGV